MDVIALSFISHLEPEHTALHLFAKPSLPSQSLGPRDISNPPNWTHGFASCLSGSSHFADGPRLVVAEIFRGEGHEQRPFNSTSIDDSRESFRCLGREVTLTRGTPFEVASCEDFFPDSATSADEGDFLAAAFESHGEVFGSFVAEFMDE